MGTPTRRRRPQGSNRPEICPDDQRGRLNLIMQEKVRQGVAEVKESLTFCASPPLDYPGGALLNPRRHPPALRPTLRDGRAKLQLRACPMSPAVHIATRFAIASMWSAAVKPEAVLRGLRS